ncbi:hypothetical protein [Scytonema sp. PCC 10023]|uniref:hypothetical protein n=1 Tax=Scytonema sp. PCC 10023 TaxID=1680591 RepID=UPI0039C69312
MNVKIDLLSAFTLSVSAFAAIPHQENRQSIYQSIERYLESFISPVKQKKVAILRRGYLLEQANRAVVLYHPVKEGTLKGRAITSNINSPQNLSSSLVSEIEFLRESLSKVNYKVEKVFSLIFLIFK